MVTLKEHTGLNKCISRMPESSIIYYCLYMYMYYTLLLCLRALFTYYSAYSTHSL